MHRASAAFLTCTDGSAIVSHVRAPIFLVVIAALVPAAARAQDCAPSDALARAAAALLEHDAPPAPDALLELVHANGSDAPVVDALIVHDGDPGRRARFLERVARRRDAPLACGEARRESRWVVLAAPRAGSIEPIREGVIRVVYTNAFRGARLYAQDVDGTLWQTDVQSGAELAVPTDLLPPVRVQLVAEGPSGPRPIAERQLGEGAQTVVVDSDEPIRERLATLRSTLELGALRENRLLARVASDHAARMCREGRVSHLDEEGDPRQRLARAGLRARHVGEVVARADDASHAYAAFLESPSHRAALTDPRFTDSGVGRAQDDGGRTCLVILLAAWPRAVPY